MNNHSETKISLTERQTEILSAMSLPTEYEALTWTQKKAIVAIEEMLQAVELKYGREFAYAGYTAKGILEPEQLWAYPVDGNRETETFVVTRKTVDGEVVYRDGSWPTVDIERVKAEVVERTQRIQSDLAQ